MTGEGWQQLKDVLQAAWEMDAGERPAFLNQIGAQDPKLRSNVEALLASDQNIGEFLSRPLVAAAVGPRNGAGSLGGGFTPVQPTELIGGRRIGPYQILREIGRGGMGTVHLGERADGLYRKRVAIKLIRAELGAADMRRFRKERQVVAILDHPNIARLLDGGVTEDGIPYLVMEYLEGERIDSWCDTRKLPVPDRLRLFRNVCAAVQYAHDKQVIHRDLKPANILVTADGTPKLLDFGIAKVLNPELFGQTIETITVPGPMTPEYASPEQVRGEHVGPASDVYALGMVLYHLLTGRLAYSVQGSDLQRIAKVICEQDPVKPSDAVFSSKPKPSGEDTSGADLTPESISAARGKTPTGLRRHLAGDLDNIVLKALRKEPERRHASVAQLSADLDRFLQNRPVQAHRETLWYLGRKFLKRNRSPATAAALTAALFLAAVAGLTRFGRPGGSDTAEPRSLAVVQIENLAQDSSLAWMDRGLCELIATNLANAKGIQVISAERVRELLGRRATSESHLPAAQVRDVAREARADLFLSGALTRRSGRIRLDLRVLETATGHVLFTGKVEGAGAHAVFDMANDAAANILTRLAPVQAAPKPNVAAALTADLEALHAYEEGLSERSRFQGPEALRAFQRAIDLDPQFVMAHYYLADSMRFYGNVPEARRTIARAVQLAEHAPVPRLEKLLAQALQLRLDLKLDGAARVLEMAHREFSQETEPLFQLANIWSAEGRFAEAATLLEEVVRMDERHALAHDQLGYYYALQGNVARGVTSIDRYAALLPPGNVVPFASRGDVYLINERYDEAIAQYRKIDHRIPLAIAAAYAGDFALSESTLESVRRKRVGWYEAAGDLAAARGQLDRTALYYEQAASLYQSEGPLRTWWALLRVGRIFLEQRLPEGLLALGRRHHSPWAAGLRGTAYLLLHKEAAAEKEFAALRDSIAPILGDYVAEKAVEFHRMQAAYYAGRYEEVIQMWPRLPRSFWNLYALDVGRAYLQAGVLTEAEPHLRAAWKAQLAFFWNQDMQAQHNYLTWMLAQFYMAQVLERTGRQSDATANYQAFLKHFEHSSAPLPQIAAARVVVARSRLSERGNLLFGDDFSGNALEAGWSGKPGIWEVSGGLAKASERAADHHGALRTHALAYHDAIFELSFRLDGAREVALALNSKSGQVCRFNVAPAAMLLTADNPSLSGTLKPDTIAFLNTAIEPGKWHKAVVAVQGKRMIAQLDDKQTIAGESPRVDVNKADFGLHVSGMSASFDYVKVYEALSK